MLGTLRIRWLLTLLPRTINYFFSASIPFLYKLTLLLPVLWMFTPIARITNVIPVAGVLDEFTVSLLTMGLFTSLSSRFLKRKEEAAQNGQPVEIVEGEYYEVKAAEQHKVD